MPRLLLLLATVAIFAGRGYGYLFFDAPLRVLLWDEALMTPFVERVLGMTWWDYAGNLRITAGFQTAIKTIGTYYMVCAGLAVAFYLRGWRWLRWPLLFGALLLLGHAFLEAKDRFYHLAQFFEFGIQVGTPVLFVGALAGWWGEARLLSLAKVLIAVTFSAHGLYALGVYPVPAHFVDMSIRGLGMSEAVARRFLTVAGVLDLVLAVAIFVPRLARPALVYATFWGFTTAAARVWVGFSIDYPWASLHQSAYATVFRLGHGLLPLWAWWVERGRGRRCRAT